MEIVFTQRRKRLSHVRCLKSHLQQVSNSPGHAGSKAYAYDPIESQWPLIYSQTGWGQETCTIAPLTELETAEWTEGNHRA